MKIRKISSSDGQDMSYSDNSNFSNSSSTETPYSSPSQQVPQISVPRTTDNISLHDKSVPKLEIIIQPQDVRFRYKTEREKGTHGSIQGVNYSNDGARKYPTVTLLNYDGKAKIKCSLAQCDSDEEHPHRIQEEERNEDQQVCVSVPADGHYTVCFPGLGVIQRKRQEIKSWLYRKLQESGEHEGSNHSELMRRSTEMEKRIELNIVRLKFSAHDDVTDVEICPPTYSCPIRNLKSVSTNQLAIKYSKPPGGAAKGGEEMVILTSKISKDNISVRFFELSPEDDQNYKVEKEFVPKPVWEAIGKISYVHAQSALVLDVPPYRDPNIKRDVNVWMQLQRTKDGAVSAARRYVYRAAPNRLYDAFRKRARTDDSALDIFGSVSDNKTDTNDETKASIYTKFPTESGPKIKILENTVVRSASTKENPNTSGNTDNESMKQDSDVMTHGSSQTFGYQYSIGTDRFSAENHLGGSNWTSFNKLETTHITSAGTIVESTQDSSETSSEMSPFDVAVSGNLSRTVEAAATQFSSTLSQTQQSLTSVIGSTVEVEFEPLEDIIGDYEVDSTGQLANSLDSTAYDTSSTSFAENVVRRDRLLSQSSSMYSPYELPLSTNDTDDFKNPAFVNYFSVFNDENGDFQLETDSDKPLSQDQKVPKSDQSALEAASTSKSKTSSYTAVYKPADNTLAKTLLYEIIRMFKEDLVEKRELIRNYLDNLFKLRLNNGDTFLHMSLQCDLPSFETTVKIINAVDMNHLLNLTNDDHQTILHLAIAMDLPRIVTFLIQKGCDPMVRDAEGNSAIHVAAMFETCLDPLLDAIQRKNVDYDLDAYNLEKQTALHISASYGLAKAARRLLSAGAVLRSDFSGRTPLHVAAANHSAPTVDVLLDYYQAVIDAVDDRGWTALQIACSSQVTEDSLAVVKLLLRNGANPTTYKIGTPTVPSLAARDKRLRDVLKEFNMSVADQSDRDSDDWSQLSDDPSDFSDDESEDDFHSADEGDVEDEVATRLDDLKLT